MTDCKRQRFCCNSRSPQLHTASRACAFAISDEGLAGFIQHGFGS